jgi:hypothetical protein
MHNFILTVKMWFIFNPEKENAVQIYSTEEWTVSHLACYEANLGCI